MNESDSSELRRHINRTTKGNPSWFPYCCWGRVIVYYSPDDSLESLTGDDLEGSFFRLIQVANNRQLRWVFKPEHELCQPKAAISAPRLHVSCTQTYLGVRGRYRLLLGLVSPCGTRHSMTIRVRKKRLTEKNKDTLAQALNMHHGIWIVGGQGFNRKCTLSGVRESDERTSKNAVEVNCK